MKLVAGGERAGKSRLSAIEPLLYILEHADKPDKLIWIVGGVYELAKPEFAYLYADLQKLGLAKKSYLPRQGSQEVQGPGFRVLTKSSDDVLRLAAEAPDFVLMVEAAQQTLEVLLRLRGRIAEKRGFLIASGTFEGSLGWMPEFWRKWRFPNNDGGISFSVPTWSNTVIFPGGRQDPEILKLEASYPPDLFLERFGAEPCPPSTLVFPEFRWEIHTKNNIVPDWETFQGEIELAIDPGYNNPYAVLAMFRSWDCVYCVDEIYRRRCLGEEIINIAKERPWWPHVTGGVIDVAGRAHAAQKSQIEIWEEQTHLQLRSQFVPIEDGITRYKSFLEAPGFSSEYLSGLPGPRIFYDRTFCPSSIAEHGKYRYRDIKEGRVTSEKPIDANNHSLKAAWYYLVDVFGYTPSLRFAETQHQPKYPRRRRAYA